MARFDVVIGAKNEASQVFNEVAKDAQRLRDKTAGGNVLGGTATEAYNAARMALNKVMVATSGLSVVMKALKGDIEGADEAAQRLPAGLGEAYKWFKNLIAVVSGASDEMARFQKETEEVDRQREELAKRWEANRAMIALRETMEAAAVREFGTQRERARLEYEQERKRIEDIAARSLVVPGSAVDLAIKRSLALADDAYRRRLAGIAAKEEQERAAAAAKIQKERAEATAGLRRWRSDAAIETAIAAARLSGNAVEEFRLEQIRRGREMGAAIAGQARKAPLRETLLAYVEAARRLMIEEQAFAKKQDDERREREKKAAEERRAAARRVATVEAEQLQEALQAAGFGRAAQLLELRRQLDDALGAAKSDAEREALRRLFAAREARIAPDGGYPGGGVGATPLTTRYQGLVDMNRPARVEAAVKRADENLERIARAIERGLDVKGIALRN